MLGAVDSTGHPPVPPASAPAASVVHPRSCHDCHRRKVRCTKIFPCENCLRLGVKCTFPPPGRKPRKTVQGSKKAELVSRLNFLEQKVQHLSAQTTGEPQTGENHRESSERIESPPFTNPVPPHSQRSEEDVHPSEQSNPPGTEALEHQFGRLLVDRGSGESRYVSNQTLIDLGDQVCGIPLHPLLQNHC